jgi:hypothetical protein
MMPQDSFGLVACGIEAQVVTINLINGDNTMSLRQTGESMAVLSLVFILTLPGTAANLVGGDGSLDPCTTSDVVPRNCSEINSGCSGTFQKCVACVAAGQRKVGLCEPVLSAAFQPCTGVALCASFENSRMYTSIASGQACVEQPCP